MRESYRKLLARKKLRSLPTYRRRRIPGLERLENRQVLAAFTPGNILVTSAPFDDVAQLIEFTPTGQQVQSVVVPQTSGAPSEKARDLVVDEQGRAQIFNGTFDTRLTTFDSAAGTFQTTTFPTWDTSGVPTYGGIAALNSFIFATDQQLPGQSIQSQGIIRLNTGNATSGWTRDFDPNIGDTRINTSQLIPHTTIRGTGDGSTDFYAFTVDKANSRAIFDIDNGFTGQVGSFSSGLRLYDQSGNVLAFNNGDVPVNVGGTGSTSRLDAYLEYTFTQPGTYSIEVGGCCDFAGVPTGSSYDLNISLANHPLYIPGVSGVMNEQEPNNFYLTAQDTENAIRFAQGTGDPIDVTVGLDGMLYVLISAKSATLGGSRVDVYDPITLQFDHSVTLPREHRAIAVDGVGHIYAVDPDIRRYSATGELISTLSNQNLGGFLGDIDLDSNGRVVVASNNGNIIVTNAALDDVNFFMARPSNGSTFVALVNQPLHLPLVVNDSFRVPEDSVQNLFSVLFNDLADSRGYLTVKSVSNPDHGGVVTILGDRSLQYSPAPNFFGIETFTYTVNDSLGGLATGTVTVRVSDVNEPPTATADSATVFEDSSGNQVDVLTNDSAAPDVGEVLSIIAVGNVTNGGTISIVGSGQSLLYSPAPNFHGIEKFSYTISDGNGGTTTATVTMTVNNTNDPPTAAADQFYVNPNSVANVLKVMDNDSSAPDPTETLTVTNVSTPNRGGTAVRNSDGTITYTPRTGYVGPESFTYTLSDGVLTNTATVSILVDIVNNPPVLADDTINVRFNSSNNQLLVLANDSTAPDVGETLLITAVSVPDGTGTVSIASNGKSLRYTPQPELLVGVDHFIYTAMDSRGKSSTASVTVNIGDYNGLPATEDDTYVLRQNSTGNTLNVLQNDIDPDGGDTLRVIAITGNPRGTVTIPAGGGSLRYDAPVPFLGTDTFTYIVADSFGGQSQATVSVSVRGWQNPVNALDVTNDGRPDALPEDVLLIINQINAPIGSPGRIIDAFGRLPEAPENPSVFYDVNGDGYCTAIDALIPINAINTRIAFTSEGESSGNLASGAEGEADDLSATISSTNSLQASSDIPVVVDSTSSTAANASTRAAANIACVASENGSLAKRLSSRKSNRSSPASEWESLLDVLASDIATTK